MTAAHEYEDMHHLVNRLSPAQVRRLRVLAETDPELARFVQPTGHEHAPEPVRRLSVTGILDSGRGDLSERHDDIIRERLHRPT